MRAWIKEVRHEYDMRGGATLKLTLIVPNPSHEEVTAVRDAMEVPLLGSEPGYQPEVRIEADGQATVELIKR